MNKKAQEKYFALWNILAIAIVTIAFLVAIMQNGNKSFDIKSIEAETLNKRILSCLTNPEGQLTKKLDENFDLFEECSFSQNLFEEKLMTKIETFSENSEKPIQTLRFGNENLEITCELQSKTTFCFNSQTKIINSENEILLLKIKTASRHGEDNE